MVYWGIPSSPEKCSEHARPVTCDWPLYGGNPTLQDNQKLVPNDDVTGRKIVQSFLASAIIALILSTTLLFDKIKVLTRKRRRGTEAVKEHQHYVKMVHTIETLLQVLSDQQLISSIALLLSVNAQACQISAYHYNLVCTMLVMGIITHLNTLMNVPDFLHKGKFLAFYRFLGMTVQIVLSGLVLSARLTKTFPSRAGPLAIMPAACFQKVGSGLGLSALGDLAANATKEGDLLANLDAATSATGGIGEYATLAIFIILAVPIIAFDYIEAKFTDAPKFKHPVGMRWGTIAISFASIVASITIVTVSFIRYNNLRENMEVPQWFIDVDVNDWTYSQILPILLLGSGSIAIVQAVTESFAGPRGGTAERSRGYEQVRSKVGQSLLNDKNQGGDDSIPLTGFGA